MPASDVRRYVLPEDGHLGALTARARRRAAAAGVLVKLGLRLCPRGWSFCVGHPGAVWEIAKRGGRIDVEVKGPW